MPKVSTLLSILSLLLTSSALGRRSWHQEEEEEEVVLQPSFLVQDDLLGDPDDEDGGEGGRLPFSPLLPKDDVDDISSFRLGYRCKDRRILHITFHEK